MEDDVRDFKRRKIQDLDQKRAHKGDSPAAKEAWVKAVKDIKDIDTAIRNGANTLAEVKTAIIQNASLVAEINKELGIAEEIVVAEETVVEPEQTSDGGVFSARLEALISAALQDGVLTEQEKAILKKRVEKEGEDWDEVEMIINARLADMNSTAPSEPSSQKTVENESEKTQESDNSPSTKPDMPVLENPVFDAREEGVKNERYVEIQEGYTEIADNSFLWGKVQRVVLPSTLKKIGVQAFYGCDQLKQIDFSKCTELLEIENRAFHSCKKLEEITLPNSVTSIGVYAFYDCKGLTSITIPNSVTNIGVNAFEDCSGLTSVTIGNSVTSIGKNAFYGCSALTSVTIGNSVTSIGDFAFNGCSALTSITIPNSVTNIGDSAFYDCKGLTSITIPNSVTSIGKNAFYGCSALTSVTIGNSVTSIGDFAFNGCSALTSLTFHCKEIGDWFNCIKSIQNIEIGDEVTSIGESAFESCHGLRIIELGKNVRKINDRAFRRCDKLKELVIRNGVEEIGENIVYDTKIKKLFLPPSIRRIGKNDYIDLYCYAPELEDLEDLEFADLFVLPQYLQAYQDQANAVDVYINIQEIPEEYRYYFDN